jgi:Family of unknown function (DUF6328)
MTRDNPIDPDAGDGRDESLKERDDRQWLEILQELRVIQTGTQVLTGFLLTLAFQPRFADLDPGQVTIYLALVVVAVIATILALAPVALHRTLFRLGAKASIVRIGNRALIATIAAVGLTLVGTAVLIFDVVVDHTAGLIAGVGALVAVVVAWMVMPVAARIRHDSD